MSSNSGTTNAISGANATTTPPAPTARVSFSIDMCDDPATTYQPRISVRGAANQARVRFRLTGLNIHDGQVQASPSVVVAEAPVVNGRAQLTVDAPPGPTVAQVTTLGGTAEGTRDFSGAQDLVPGNNVVTVNPTNSRLSAERTADTVARVRFALTGLNVHTVPTTNLVAEARSTVLGSRGRQRPNPADDDKPAQGMLRRIVNPSTQTDPMIYAEVGVQPRQGLMNPNGQRGPAIPDMILAIAGFNPVDAGNFWTNTDLSEPTVDQMRFKEVLRQGLGGWALLACEHRTFNDCFAVTRISWNSARELSKTFVRHRGYTYATLCLDDGVYVGGSSRTRMKPVLFKWTGQANGATQGARNTDTEDNLGANGWVRYFDNEAITPTDPNAGVTAVRLEGEVNGVKILIVSVKDAASGQVRVYRVRADNGRDPSEEPGAAEIARRGALSGSVRQAAAAGTTTPAPALEGVQVEIYNSAGEFVASKTTDADGVYAFNVPVATGYRLQFSKTGYQPLTRNAISITENEAVRLDPVFLLPTSETGTGNLWGFIDQASNGQGAPGLTVRLIPGMDNTTGTPVQTATTWTQADATAQGQPDRVGYYQFTDIPAGAYTILVVGGGTFNDLVFNCVIRTGQDTANQSGAVSPRGDPNQIRMVLTWRNVDDPVREAQTSNRNKLLDLDAHLEGPMDPALNANPADPAMVDFFHMYYRYAYYSNGVNVTASASLYCQQDYGLPLNTLSQYVEQLSDSRNGYGPEAITLKYFIAPQKTPRYSFFVHHYYTSDSNATYVANVGGIRTTYPDNLVGQSQAVVKVFKGERELATYYVPANQQGFMWHVFDMFPPAVDGEDPVLIPVNEMYTYAQVTGQSASYRAGVRASAQGGHPGVAALSRIPPKHD